MFRRLRNLFSKKKKKEEPKRDLNKELIDVLTEIYASDPAADITIRTAKFDVKYKKDLMAGEDITPSEIVTQFKRQADKGDNRFLRHYFYRVLRKNGDPVIRKLKYRLKRAM